MKRAVDKVVVTTDMKDGHGITSASADDSDRGCVIDFAQMRLGGGLGAIRKEVRGWIGSPNVPSPQGRSPEKRTEKPDPVGRDPVTLLARWHRLEPDKARHPTVQCGLDVGLLSPRQVRRDERGDAFFPHSEEDEVCGWEEVGQPFRPNRCASTGATAVNLQPPRQWRCGRRTEMKKPIPLALAASVAFGFAPSRRCR